MSSAEGTARVEALRDFARRRDALLDALDALEPMRLRARPAPNAWSILEVVEHMVLAERAVLRDLPDPATLVGRPRRLRDRLGYGLVVFILTSRLRVQVPDAAMLPQGERTLEELRAMWEENQAWLLGYVEGLDEVGASRAVFHHPITGPLDVDRAIRLGRIHFDRHLGQIERLRTA